VAKSDVDIAKDPVEVESELFRGLQWDRHGKITP
jgi:hypothetical protein